MKAAAFSWDVGRSKQVVYIGRDDRHIHELSVVSGADWTHTDLTALINDRIGREVVPRARPSSGIVGYEWPEGRSKQVAFVDDRGDIHELYVVAGDPNGWQHANLTTLANRNSSTGVPPVPAP